MYTVMYGSVVQRGLLLFILSIIHGTHASISTTDPAQLYDSVTNSIQPTIDIQYTDKHTDNNAIHTNKFYTNLLLYDPKSTTNNPIYPQPYIVTPLSIHSQFARNGLSISYSNHKTFGSKGLNSNGVEYMMNVLSYDIVLSASEFRDVNIDYHVVDPDVFSVTWRQQTHNQYIDTVLLYGSAYVTSIYHDVTPVFYSNNAIIQCNDVDMSQLDNTCELHGNSLKLQFNNEQIWKLYFYADAKNEDSITFKYSVASTGTVFQASNKFNGVIRVALLDNTDSDIELTETLFDKHRNVYADSATVEYNVESDDMQYTINWSTQTIDTEHHSNTQLLHYALTHHIDHLKQSDTVYTTDHTIESTTKGEMTAVVGNKWTMKHSTVPNAISNRLIQPIDFDTLTDEQIELLQSSAADDVDTFDVKQTIAIESNYYFGKYALRLGQLCLITEQLQQYDTDYTNIHRQCVDKLTELMNAFIDGDTANSLVYDTTFGGMVGNLGLDDVNIDFMSSVYNDHHYHYGYIIHAAAIVASLNTNWLCDNKIAVDYINTLIRDTNNPWISDTYFPQYRYFDWYNGHSWSHGAVLTPDGKDEESTSEEVNYAYALIQWGTATKQQSIIDLGSTLYTILHNTLQTYFLLTNDNKIMPKQIVANHITGILTEFKIAYQTWFDSATEAIHGIQMLPFIPTTPHIRTHTFVTQEWNDIYNSIADVLNDSTNKWASILLLNYATIDSQDAYNRLTNNDITVDDGLSQTYALYWCLTIDSLQNDISPTLSTTMLSQHVHKTPKHTHNDKHQATHWSKLYKVFLLFLLAFMVFLAYAMYTIATGWKFRVFVNSIRHTGRNSERIPLLS